MPFTYALRRFRNPTLRTVTVVVGVLLGAGGAADESDGLLHVSAPAGGTSITCAAPRTSLYSTTVYSGGELSCM